MAGTHHVIRWPERFLPSQSPVHVVNELLIQAPAEMVWEWLARASGWPHWYPNSRNVRIAGGAVGLTIDAEFDWVTFGVPVHSRVVEFTAPLSVAWTARAPGLDAYHAWLLEPVAGGTRVLTEETQHGWLARLNAFLFPRRMHRHHQIWLEQLGRMARTGTHPGMRILRAT